MAVWREPDRSGVLVNPRPLCGLVIVLSSSLATVPIQNRDDDPLIQANRETHTKTKIPLAVEVAVDFKCAWHLANRGLVLCGVHQRFLTWLFNTIARRGRLTQR